jgi:hypothetical protein
MASGHEYRTSRPNTWLLRPTLQVKILLANLEPSTHGPSRSCRSARAMSAAGLNRKQAIMGARGRF